MSAKFAAAVVIAAGLAPLQAMAQAPTAAQAADTQAHASAVTIGDLSRAQARAIEGEMAELLGRARGAQPAAAAPAPSAPPQTGRPGAPGAEVAKAEEPRAPRFMAPPPPPARTHIAFLALYGEPGNVTMEFELPNGEIVQRRSGDRIGDHRIEVAPSGRVLLVGKTLRQVRPGDRFN